MRKSRLMDFSFARISSAAFFTFCNSERSDLMKLTFAEELSLAISSLILEAAESFLIKHKQR